ncbi:MAG: hypothetical protein LUD51_04380 [Clostridia bacterium]|nr:hypothetical protein [Clostridia bacterium]
MEQSSYEDTRPHAYEDETVEWIAEDKFGTVLARAVHEDKLDRDDFCRKFADSEVAKAFENGNPDYICFMSDTELLDMVLGRKPRDSGGMYPFFNNETFMGSVYVFVQWRLNLPFKALFEACPPSELVKYRFSKYWGIYAEEFLDVFRKYLPEEDFDGIADTEAD